MRAVKNHADESNTRKSNMRLYRYRRGHPMNPYPYGTSCPVSMHLALFAVNLALYGFGVLVSLKLAQDCTVRGQSLPGVTNDCDRALRRRTGLSVRRYPLDRQAIQECGRTLKVG